MEDVIHSADLQRRNPSAAKECERDNLVPAENAIVI
jgi:hypothetical protein